MPSSTNPVPAAQLLQGAQFSFPVTALNCPLAHGVQVRSELVVGATLMNSPGEQGERTVLHAESSFTSEKLNPSTQAVHSLFFCVDPSESLPCPSPHVLHGAHASTVTVDVLKKSLN